MGGHPFLTPLVATPTEDRSSLKAMSGFRPAAHSSVVVAVPPSRHIEFLPDIAEIFLRVGRSRSVLAILQLPREPERSGAVFSTPFESRSNWLGFTVPTTALKGNTIARFPIVINWDQGGNKGPEQVALPTSTYKIGINPETKGWGLFLAVESQ